MMTIKATASNVCLHRIRYFPVNISFPLMLKRALNCMKSEFIVNRIIHELFINESKVFAEFVQQRVRSELSSSNIRRNFRKRNTTSSNIPLPQTLLRK